MTLCRSAWVAVAAVAFTLPAQAADLRALDIFANRNAFMVRGGAQDRMPAALGLIFLERMSLSAESAAAKSSVSLLYDGDAGSLDSAGRSFLEFDGPRAVVTLEVPAWRRASQTSFTAMEASDAPGVVRLEFRGRRGERRSLAAARTVIASGRAGVLVRYDAALPPSLPDGVLRLDYTAGGAAAFLGEWSLDGIGAETRSAAGEPLRTIDRWKETVAPAQCPEVQRSYRALAVAGGPEVVRMLTPAPNAGFGTQLVYWRVATDSASGLTTHALMFRVDDTGDPLLDFVRAWLVVPPRARRPAPLVILPHQGHVYGSHEPLGVLGEQELALAPELLGNGVAVLALDAAAFGTPYVGYPPLYFRHYPRSGMTAKDLDNVKRLITWLLGPDLSRYSRTSIDRARIGIWGYSYGAWISMLAAAVDDRIRAVAFSAFHYHDSYIAPGLAAALYIPQLSCLTGEAEHPISVRRLLSEYRRPVFAVAPDVGLFAAWTQGLDDPRITVVGNPFNHLVSLHERAEVADFFFGAFGLRARAARTGPVHDLPREAGGFAPYVERDNRWRTELLKALAAP
jgi:dienelactone hydrolase